jgi:hypothetical protein
MTYLVKYTDPTQDFPQPADIDVIDRWEFVEEICEGNSLLNINPYLRKKGFPGLNNLTNFRINGIILVYSNSVTEQIYILDSEHKGCVQIMRDYKLKNILN